MSLLDSTVDGACSFATLDIEVAVYLIRQLEDLSDPEEGDGDENHKLEYIVERCEMYHRDGGTENSGSDAVEGAHIAGLGKAFCVDGHRGKGHGKRTEKEGFLP